nr:hypothetical protein [Tanacetum cinerariifolium]
MTLTLVHSDGQQESSSTSSFVTSLLNSIIDLCMESIFTTASSSVPIPSEVLQNLLTFESVFRFEDRVNSLEVNFLEFMRTNQFPEAVSNIPGIVHQYMQQEMTEAVREAVQIQANRLQDSLQRENDEFLRTIDDNMKKIIKEQVKTDLSEMELKKILIDKMEGNKSIQRSDEQRNLYKALVKAYEADKTILDSYGESTILKRRRREHASASTPSKPATRSAGRSTTGTQSRQLSASESAFAKEPVQTTYQMEEPSLPVFETGVEDQPIVQTSQHLE